MRAANIAFFRAKLARMLKTAVTSVVAFSMLVSPVMAATPNDPLYQQQWYLEAIGMKDAWNFAKGSPTVRVAVLDSGIDLTHPDLAGRVWTNRGEIPGDHIDNDKNGYVDDVHGWDFVDNDADPNPDVSDRLQVEGINHGTLVAGIIGAAGNNAEGVAGMNWNVEIMPLRVLDSGGSGRTSAVEAAIRYAVAQKARVINISFSGPNYSASLAETLRQAYKAGSVIVAAAGNEGDTIRGGNLNVYPEYPACYRGANNETIVIGVSSLDKLGRRSSFSNYGANCISVSAPGENIHTTQVLRPELKGFESAYGDGWAGSSLAAPIVSGLAALLLSLDPALTPTEVRAEITSHAVNVDDVNGAYAGQLGTGRVDAAASVAAVVEHLYGTPVSVDQPVVPPFGGSLVKSPQSAAVYYAAIDGRRYVFPNEKTYASWYPNFSSVRTISAADLARMPIGGMVTYRPGTRMLKLPTMPQVYVVAKGGVLRPIASEAVARDLYGAAWPHMIDDLPEEFFVGYRVGLSIGTSADFVPGSERDAVPTIEADRNLVSEPLSKP